jgi:hypothetical protein
MSKFSVAFQEPLGKTIITRDDRSTIADTESTPRGDSDVVTAGGRK